MCLKSLKQLTKERKAKDKMHFYMLLLCLFFMQFLNTSAVPCDSCGNECASACGTKHFRTCCFNYLRKRTDPNAMKLITNKRLIDFIMLQGRAMFTEDGLSHERKQQQQQQQQQQKEQLQQDKQLQQLEQDNNLLLSRSSASLTFPFYS